MTAITVFNGLFCDAEPVVEHVLNITGYRLVDDREIIADAARLSGMSEELIAGAFPGGTIAAEDTDCGREQAVSWLRLAVAEKLANEENLVLMGYSSLLPPPDIANILKVCLISEMSDRLWTARRERRLDEAKARELIHADDEVRGTWVLGVTECNDPWCRDLHDVVIPVGSTGIKESACLIVEQLANRAVQDSPASRQALEDFLLAASVQAQLARDGHDLKVSAADQALTLRFDSHERTLRNATHRLFDAVSAIDGVQGVEIGVGRRYNPTDIYQVIPCLRHPGLARAAECTGSSDSDRELAVKVREALPKDGLDLSVYVRKGFVSLAVNDHRSMLEQISKTLCETVSGFEGVRSVEIGLGREYHQAEAYASMRLKQTRTLLDNEKRKFFHTLSERLLATEPGSFAVYDGKAAFFAVRDSDPEVLMLDLPNLDGAEVLRRIKRDHPKTQILVLTEKGAERECETCLNLGAFASLSKPVNTAALSDTIRAASEQSRLYS